MLKEVVMCQDCVNYTYPTDGVMGKCKHINALAFPNPTDFCSYGELNPNISTYENKKNQEELLKRVYNERRGR